MLGRLFFLAIFLHTVPVAAADSVCRQVAEDQDFVHIRYNYGELGFDATKSLQEIDQICEDNAAGCFHGNFGVRRLKVSDKTLRVRRDICVIPEVDITYDFSGATVYITRDYSSCATRAVLRHELQHFMIWKTAKEWFLKDLRYSLKQAVRDRVISCSHNERCSTVSYATLEKVVTQVETRWKKIETQYQTLLDTVDHSETEEVNYTVCAPYSLKVGLF